MLRIPAKEDLRETPLYTERCVLAPLLAEEADEVWSVVDDNRAWLSEWISWVPHQKNLEDFRLFTKASAHEWDLGRALRLTIREKKGRQLLGVVGLENLNAIHRRCEIGYWLRQSAAGSGLMTEAAARCLQFAFETLGMHRVRVAAGTNNHPSLRVIERLHFRYEGREREAEWVNNRWIDHAVYGLLEAEWRGRQST